MGDRTHTMAVLGTGFTSKQISVPALEQRAQGICIDDEVEVTIHDPTDLIDQASFTAPQTAGDSITIPADVVRTLELEAEDRLLVGFEKVEEVDNLPGAIPDDEVEEALDEADNESDKEDTQLGELFSEEDEEDEEDEEESSLAGLFG